MKVYKDGVTHELRNSSQLDAFLQSGWTAVDDSDNPADDSETAEPAAGQNKPKRKQDGGG